MTYTMLLFAVLLAVASATKIPGVWKKQKVSNWEELDHKSAFEEWKEEFNKFYNDIREEAGRFLQFRENWKSINEHNAADLGWTLALNEFADLSLDEFRYRVHGHHGSCLMMREPMPVWRAKEFGLRVTHSVNNPTAIDWTNIDGKTYVTDVKNQGQCGSCWAFSTTGSLESRYAIKYNQTGKAITTLSEQELVDCSSAQGNQGCNGGLMDNAFEYIEKAGGLCSEEEYPYKAVTGRKCLASDCAKHYDAISSYKDVTSDSESSLETAVAAGPVSIAVDAGGMTWQFYSGGIVTGHCGTSLDHGVLTVGYGVDGSQKYWKVKNSWGSSWGESGYLRICKECNKNGDKGECGIAMQPSYPLPQ